MNRCVVSFPKSGRTWLRVMLDELGVDIDYSHAGASHRDRRLFDELTTSLSNQYDRIVFLSRDPRDTVVSGYYQASRRSKRKYQGSISDFIRDHRHGIRKVCHFNRMWRTLAEQCNAIHVLSYEDMQADTAKALSEVLDFLEEIRLHENINEVVSRNTFSLMQAREIRGEYSSTYGKRLRPGDPSDFNSLKVRRGKVGGYRDDLCREDIRYCSQIMSDFA